jgi:hypothetical protein
MALETEALEWESVARLRAGFDRPEFKAALAGYADSAVASPRLLLKLAVRYSCVGP